jgi:DEAD/DEAH box helicase domain-containing protein
MLEGKNIVVFDCEIENDVDGKNVTWATKDKMGFSVGCLFDYRTGDYGVYFKEDIKRFAERLNQADLIVGFNILGFDNELVRAQGGPLLPDDKLKHWDILYYSRLAMGWREGDRYPKGMRLDDHLKATFGEEFMKTEDGALAPKMWRDGRRGEVVSYCLADVRREKMLFEYIAHNGYASTAEHGRKNFDIMKINDLLRPTDIMFRDIL